MVDRLGRTTRDEPGGEVTYTVYKDPHHEMRVYRGWDSSSASADRPDGGLPLGRMAGTSD